MLYLKDKPKNVWSWTDPDDIDRVCYEDGTSQPLTTDKLVFSRGKYEGLSLDQVIDVGYLNWLLSVANKEKDIYLGHCIDKRIKELV